MISKGLVLRAAAVLVSLFCASTVAQAQATRTWVSGVGDDVNPCSRTAPCKTFSGAISKTAAGGEIDALDPAGFGAITITKAITISGDGTLAGILNALSSGIIINAGVNDDVVIRNISIQGVGTGLHGIRYLAGRSVLVENCSISGINATGHGIDMSLAVNASGQLNVVNTTFSKIGGVAVRMTGSGIGTRTANLSNVRIRGAGFGFDVLNGVGNIAKSFISNVTNQAVVAEAGAVINVDDSVLTNNGTGVSALSTATVRIANTAILHNGTGINIAVGSTVASFGGNKNIGNTTAGAPNANIVLQ